MPSKENTPPYSLARFMPDPPRRVSIDAATHRLLILLQRETGTGPTALLRGTGGDKPDGLDAEMVHRWICRGSFTARKDHLDYVLEKWNVLSTEGAHKVAICEDARRKLAGHRNRSGVGPDRLLKSRDDLPQGLNAPMVTHWLAGRIRTARACHLDYVLRLWAGLPDRQVFRTAPRVGVTAVPNPELKFTPLTKEAVAALRRYRDATNLGPSRFMEKAKDPPEGLTFAMIANWLAGRNSKVRRELLDYVLDEWKRMALEGLEAVTAPADTDKEA